MAVANRDLGYHNVAVLHAGQAMEHMFKGLLLGVGAIPGRAHDLVALADDCAEHAALELEDGSLRDDLRVLTRDHNPSRYPDAVPQGTPRGNYARSDADGDHCGGGLYGSHGRRMGAAACRRGGRPR